MSGPEVRPVPPVELSILVEAGRLGGSNGRYEKFLPDLEGLYRDSAAYAMTRGHLHAVSDRSELYLGLSGQGVMILETVDGASEVIERAGGMKSLVVVDGDGWSVRPNPDHTGYRP